MIELKNITVNRNIATTTFKSFFITTPLCPVAYAPFPETILQLCWHRAVPDSILLLNHNLLLRFLDSSTKLYLVQLTSQHLLWTLLLRSVQCTTDKTFSFIFSFPCATSHPDSDSAVAV